MGIAPEGDIRAASFADDPAGRAIGRGGDLRDARGRVKPGALVASELRALSSASGIGDALTPIEQSDEVLRGLEAKSVFLAAGAQVIRTEQGSITLPHEQGDTRGLADWTAEGADITEATPDGEGLVVTPQKVAALVTVPNEVVVDSNPDVLRHLQDRLLRALALKADAGFFQGTGTAPQIRGLRATSGIQSITTLGANGATPTSLDPWADALGGVITQNGDEESVAVFMHGRTWTTLLKLKDTASRPLMIEQTVGPTGVPIRSIYGRPVFITDALDTDETRGTSTDASSSYVVDMSRVFAVERTDGTRVDVDTSAKFGADSTQVRAKARLALVVPDAEAVARIVGIRP
jgi:HK97 family phage major capsid protein